jgi:hypothetical protein
MESKDLTFFGAPYPPSPKEHIMDFPVAFCMFINMERVGQDLDFMPSGQSGWASDTGFKIYQKYKQPMEKWGIALPTGTQNPKYKTTTLSIDMKYGIKHDFDEYWWRDKLFGVHAHMKVHLRTPEERRQRTKMQLKTVKNIIERARHDFLI